MSLGATSAITDPESVFTVQTDSDLDASIYTERSFGHEYSVPKTLSHSACYTTRLSKWSENTSQDAPTLPSHSTADTTATSLSPSTDHSRPPRQSEMSSVPTEDPSTDLSNPPGPESTMSSDSTLIWSDMGPHPEGDITHPLFQDIYSMKYLKQLSTAQWFLNHMMIEHRSLAHRLLIVSIFIAESTIFS